MTLSPQRKEIPHLLVESWPGGEGGEYAGNGKILQARLWVYKTNKGCFMKKTTVGAFYDPHTTRIRVSEVCAVHKNKPPQGFFMKRTQIGIPTFI